EAEGKRGRVFGIPPIQRYNYTEDGEPVSGPVSGLVGTITGNPEPVPITWEQLPSGIGETKNCANNVLYLLRWQGKPFCVSVTGQSKGARKKAMLQVLALDRATAQGALDELLRLTREQSVYKGSIVSIERYDRNGEDFAVRFQESRPADRDDIVLPEDVLETVERNVLGFLTHADTLRQAGRSTRHGVLL